MTARAAIVLATVVALGLAALCAGGGYFAGYEQGRAGVAELVAVRGQAHDACRISLARCEGQVEAFGSLLDRVTDGHGSRVMRPAIGGGP